MRYLDTFSGIGSASLAWEPLGWQCVAHAEVSAFPAAVLAHRFPYTPNYGDCTKHEGWPDEPVELVCGGTPCQSFSVAGLRQGLLDPRGNLTLTFLGIVDQYRPSWVVWENVPGILSHDGGRSLAAVLGALGKLGYRWAYRVLDAQYVRVDGFPYAVPQRRRRLFVVGHIADWRYPAAVLFEPEGLLGYSPPRRKAGQGIAPSLKVGSGGSGGHFDQHGQHGGLIPAVGNCLTQRMHKGVNTTMDEGQTMIPAVSNALAARDYKLPRAEDNVGIIAMPVSHSLKAEGFDASEDGTGRGIPLVASPISANEANTYSHAGNNCGQVHNVIAMEGRGNGRMDDGALARSQDMSDGTMRAVRQGEGGSPSQERGLAGQSPGKPGETLSRLSHQGAPAPDLLDLWGQAQRSGFLQQALPTVQEMGRPDGRQDQPEHTALAVRRLTPRECERLQGLPDDWTDVPWRGKDHAPDGPRYKAIGNGWAVNTARWIGYRIAEVEAWISETGGYR